MGAKEVDRMGRERGGGCWLWGWTVRLLTLAKEESGGSGGQGKELG